MNWKSQLEGTLYPFEIVCPDGFSRHFPYANEEDAESDARVAEQSSCQFFPHPNRLELAFGPCPSGKHTVRKKAEA